MQKDVVAWKAVYGPLLSKYAPQTKTLPGQDEKEQDCAVASDQLYQLYADTKKESYPGAYKLTFRNKERTLAAEEVDKAMKKILNGLQDLGIELRV